MEIIWFVHPFGDSNISAILPLLLSTDTDMLSLVSVIVENRLASTIKRSWTLMDDASCLR